MRTKELIMTASLPRADAAPTPIDTSPLRVIDSVLPTIVTADERDRRIAQISADEGRRFELIDGEEVVSPSPIPDHQEGLLRLTLVVAPFVRVNGLGRVLFAPTDVYLGEYGVVVPDLVFVSTERLSLIGPKRIDGAPDLVVEILSPSTRRDDLGRKFAMYAKAGVREYWLVDLLARRIDVYALVGDTYVLFPEDDDGAIVSHVLPGLVIDVVALFSGM
jgi:Uma2 family endonuclease